VVDVVGVVGVLELVLLVELEIVVVVGAGVGESEVIEVVDVVELEEVDVGAADEVVVLVAAAELVVDEAGASIYSCSLLPAPQYVDLSPGQRKEQSPWLEALTLPACRALPQ